MGTYESRGMGDQRRPPDVASSYAIVQKEAELGKQLIQIYEVDDDRPLVHLLPAAHRTDAYRF